jgi:hypothetical protein
MRSLKSRPRLLLLDANAVFAAFRYGAWEKLCVAYEVVVPATVVRVEAMFYDSRETGRRVYLDLPALVQAGTISEYERPPQPTWPARSRAFDPRSVSGSIRARRKRSRTCLRTRTRTRPS